MNWLTKSLSVSVNRNIINKNETGASLATGFESAEVNANELAALIKLGFAYAPQMEGGQRNGKNFVYSSVLSADFDGNVTPEQAGQHPLIKEGGTIVYTTASHTRERPRFRVVFVLEDKIEDPKAFRAATEALALKLGSDPNVKDPGRLFFGNSNAQIKTFNRGLSATTVKELISLRYNAPDWMERDSRSGTSFRATRSEHTFSADIMVRPAHGEEMPLSAVSYPNSLFCPFHDDQNASAFLVRSERSGQKGIHCSTCQMTYWPVRESVFQTSFNDAAKRALSFSKQYEDEGTLAEFMTDGTFVSADDNVDMIPGLKRSTIAFLNTRYLPDNIPIDSGITYIKSPKGTGKTTFLRALVRNPKLRVLLVGHRQALLRSMAQNLGLNCYLDDGRVPPSGWKDRYAVSLDSIMKAPPSIEYDFVLVDESEQVLAHLLSDTMVEKRRASLIRLQHFAKKSKHTIALDADLGWPTFRFFSRSRGFGEAKIIINDYQEEKGTLSLFGSSQHIAEEIRATFGSGQKCYVTSNSKATIDSLAASMRSEFPKARILSITSDNSKLEEAQSVLCNTSSAIDYDMILTSPSVSSGVDFNFEDHSEGFHVYGIFLPLILTHFECDQQLARMRAPRSINVYMSASKFEYDTNLDAVRMDLLEARLANDCNDGLTDDGAIKFDPENPLLDLAACVETLRRSSMNRLLENFIEYRRADGWTIRRVESEDKPLDGFRIFAEGNRLAKEAAVDALVSAEKIDHARAAEIKSEIEANRTISSADKFALMRHQIEKFYRKDISPELIAIDYAGRTRAKVLIFEQITDSAMVGHMRNQLEQDLLAEDFRLLRHRRGRGILLTRVLEMLDLSLDGKFDLDRIIDPGRLHAFVEFVVKHKAVFETAFEGPIRADFLEKPVASLNNILSFAALKVTKRGTQSVAGDKRYLYGLDKKELSLMEDISFSRHEGSEEFEAAEHRQKQTSSSS